MTDQIKIPFGRHASGTIVSVDAVERGLDCNCVCCACGESLVARKGEINQHHFAHYVDAVCVYARETAIHNFAKHTIANALEFRLPDDLDLGPVQETKVEEWLDGIRPDVLVWLRELVAVEIRVAHPVPSEKIKKLALRGLTTVEIDLSAYKNADKDEREWTDLVLKNARRFWLVEPAVVRSLRAIEIEAMRQREQQERFRREFLEAAQRRDQEFKSLFIAGAARRVREREMLQRKQEQEEEEYQLYRAKLRDEEESHAYRTKDDEEQIDERRIDELIEGLSENAKQFFRRKVSS